MDVNEKKIEILKAASECFARYGYEKTTLEDIGKLVGLNKASLYYYYKNKESIYTEIICTESENFLIELKNKISKIEGCSEKILAYIAERFKYHTFFKGLIDTFIKEEVKLLNNILESCSKKEEIIPCDTKKVAESILTVANAIKMKTCNSMDYNLNNKFDYSTIEEEVKFTVSLILNGIIKR